ncbi:alpha/beta fold hydrolase [Vibrio lentus]|uniref:alpha/beta fold hydrolase n=2 Tax=Vibrio lentus TaxID=136468 RepID=UPI00178C974C|nr:alpha/beta hydrolase [Vibrio lentus]MDN3628050.1 alpha/beta hydrolase [Vibrio lentus]MDN3631355.1 alpha/beta hydrolase [Vibrio lentus]MDN3632577.1 alpha/beta hydrolase [Vibrio lentus]MDN3632866.1 alpha/beta hydrolase [Vibrio lentus]
MTTEIILLRGLFRGSYHWGNFTERLSTIFPDCPISCIDIPGNGYLSSEISPNTISGMVESVRNQRNRQGKVLILAVSMGGMVGLKWAELYPQEVESVICVNTTAKDFSPFYERLLPRNYLRIVKALFSSSLSREGAIYQMVSNQPFNRKTVNEWANHGQKYPISVANFWRQLRAATGFVVSRPQCELHFVASLNDGLVNSNATQAMAKKWGARVIVNEIDGHDVALDNPEWLLKVVGSIWLKAKQIVQE